MTSEFSVHCRGNHRHLDPLILNSEHSVKTEMETEKPNRDSLLAALFIRWDVICRLTGRWEMTRYK